MLDFDAFPERGRGTGVAGSVSREEDHFHFDIDSVTWSCYFPQTVAGTKESEVVAVTVALEVIARYEAYCSGSAGYHPGVVTTSTLAALNLHKGEGVAVLAKLSGHALTIAVIASGALKLFRCVSVVDSYEEELLAVLHPTFAYVEDG